MQPLNIVKQKPAKWVDASSLSLYKTTYRLQRKRSHSMRERIRTLLKEGIPNCMVYDEVKHMDAAKGLSGDRLAQLICSLKHALKKAGELNYEVEDA